MTVVAATSAVLVVAGMVSMVWARRRFLTVIVNGPSMEPSLRDGDHVLAQRIGRAPVNAGQVVVIRRPPPWATLTSAGASSHRSWGLLVKRVAAVDGEPVPVELIRLAPELGPLVPGGHVVVLGDNRAHSVDSRHFGFVPLTAILGVVGGVRGELTHEPREFEQPRRGSLQQMEVGKGLQPPPRAGDLW